MVFRGVDDSIIVINSSLALRWSACDLIGLQLLVASATMSGVELVM